MSKKLMLVAVMIGLVSILALPMLSLAAEGDIGDLTNFGANTSLPKGDLQTTAAKLINAALGLLGLVAVVIILIGGFKWMTAMGAEDKVKTAKNLIIQGVIGLIIVVCAYAIAQFVITAIQSATTA
jgi:uncharacterized membrane protein YjgN (DUF898 family)